MTTTRESESRSDRVFRLAAEVILLAREYTAQGGERGDVTKKLGVAGGLLGEAGAMLRVVEEIEQMDSESTVEET